MTEMKNAQPGLPWTNVKTPTGPGWRIIVHEAVMFLVSKFCLRSGSERNRRRIWYHGSTASKECLQAPSPSFLPQSALVDFSRSLISG